MGIRCCLLSGAAPLTINAWYPQALLLLLRHTEAIVLVMGNGLLLKVSEGGMRKLVVGVTRMLLLCDVVMALPAIAASQPISRRSVLTTEKNFFNKTVFMPGDRITYHADVDTTPGSSSST